MNETAPQALCCRLTTQERQQRRMTVFASLRGKIETRKETTAGYHFRFPFSDAILDELTAFIKLEKACCPFFAFTLRLGSEDESVWLELSGPDGVKAFIRDELGFVHATIL